MNTTLFLYLGIYTALLFIISWYFSRKETNEDFLIANRDRKWWAVAASKFAGAIGVGYFVAYTGYAYEYGLGVYLVGMGFTVGYTIFALWAVPRIYAFSKEKHFYTIGDFVEHSTKSRAAGLFSNLLTNIIMFVWLLVGFIGGAKIISHFGLMSYELALLLTIGIVVFYVLISGFKAVLATDVVQAIIIFVLMGLLTFVIVDGVGVGELISAQTGSIETSTALGFFIFSIFSIFSSSNFFQLIYASKTSREATKGILVSILPALCMATFLLMVGVFMFVQSPGLDPALVFLEALSGYLPSGLLSVGIVLFFAGLMSSADTNIYGIASHYVFSTNSKKPVRDIRYAIVAIGVLSLAIGYFFRDIIDVTIVAASISIFISVAVMYLIGGGSNVYRFFGSTVGSIFGLIVGAMVVGIVPALGLFVFMGSIIGLLYNGWLLPHSSKRITQ